MEITPGFDPRQISNLSLHLFSVVLLSIICSNINNFLLIWKKQRAVGSDPVVVRLIRGNLWF